MIDRSKYKALVELLIAKDVDVVALGLEVDALIKWRRISWLPAPIARWLEKNDDGLIQEIVRLLVNVRNEMIEAGSLQVE